MNKPISQEYICQETGEFETLEFQSNASVPDRYVGVSEFSGKIVEFVRFDVKESE
jgi:hypothetical protein|tara:strand:+ start:2173 stop:2337 length:165 start_codon:yes stop_codon:yes gene_type:complete